MAIEKLIENAMVNGYSDIHLTQGLLPYIRSQGQMVELTGEPEVNRELIYEVIGAERGQELESGKDMDFATAFCGGRQRVNIYWDAGRLCAAIRLLNDHIPTLEELQMPQVVRDLIKQPNGLILVTGPTGSGKSTTLAAMVDEIAKERSCHIITVEDPIEYQYTSGRSLVHQREVGRDVGSFAGAIRSALREDPDVVLVGEMRDYETISTAVTTAETGHLVLSTLHTTSAVRTVERIIDVFPAEAKGQIRTQLTGVLRGIITQKLLPLADGSGRMAATEIMLGNDAVLNLIREGKTHLLTSTIQSNSAAGMKTMEKCLAELVKAGKISLETALLNTSSREELRRNMR